MKKQIQFYDINDKRPSPRPGGEELAVMVIVKDGRGRLSSEKAIVNFDRKGTVTFFRLTIKKLTIALPCPGAVEYDIYWYKVVGWAEWPEIPKYFKENHEPTTEIL